MRGVHGAGGREPGQLVLLPGRRHRRPRGGDDRGPGRLGLPPARGRGLHAARRRPVRLLHLRHAADRQGAGRPRPARRPGRDRRGDERQPVPLHRLPARSSTRSPRSSASPHERRRPRAESAVGPRAESAVGQSVERADGRLKLAGQAEFTGDIRLPGMLYGAVLHSPVAHARITSIDTSAAEKLDGVVAILTGDDLSDLDPYYGHALRDRPIVAIGKVRFTGEPVAVVAARVPGRRRPRGHPASTSTTTSCPSRPRSSPPWRTTRRWSTRSRPGLAARTAWASCRDADGNVCYSYSFRRGDVDRAFAEAAVVVEGEYTFPAVYQYSMETHTTIAHWHGGELTLWSSCQHPFLVRQEIAVLFGLPLDLVQVIVPFLGGGFGSKSYTKMEPLTAAIARKAGRPVRILNGVHESMITTRRHNMTCADAHRGRGRRHRPRPGRAEAWLDTGAYADNGPRVTATAGDAAPGPYRWQALDVRAHCVYTNTGPPAPTARSAPPTCSGSGSRSWTRWPGGWAWTGWRSAAGTCCARARRSAPAASPSTPTSSATSKRPPQPSAGPSERAGRQHPRARGAHAPAPAIPPHGPPGAGPRRLGRPARGRGPSRLHGHGADGPGRVGHGPGRHHRTRPGRPHRDGPDRGRGARGADGQGRGARHRHQVHAVRPVHRGEPVHHGGGPGRPAGRAGRPGRAARDGRGPAGGSAAAAHPGRGRHRRPGRPVDDPRRAGPRALRLRRRRAHRPRPGPARRRQRLLRRGPGLLGGLRGRRRGGGGYSTTGVVTVLRTSTVADVGKAINPQLVARQDEGATLQGIGNALFEEMHFRAGRHAAERHPAQLPDPRFP